MPSKSKPFYVNGVTMSHNTLPTVAELSGEMRERLAKVKYVFTDLDATMLAPGSCVLRDNDGNPSTKLVEAVVALARAGIQVVPTSGRNRTMIHEDARVLGLNSYIGEMGGLVMYDLKANDWEYLTGDMPYDPACGLTPHQVIEQTGVCEKILARWPHKIEYHNDMSTGYKYREVTVGMRGDVPDNEVQAILDSGCIAFTAEDCHRYGSPNCEAAGKQGALMGLESMLVARLTSIPPASTRALPSRASASTWGLSARRRSRSAIPSPTSTWPITWARSAWSRMA